jgi:hypothetical protein
MRVGKRSAFDRFARPMLRAVVAGCLASCVLLVPAALPASPAAPAVWFAPLPLLRGAPYAGSTDFSQLFAKKAWPQASRRVSVFKFYGQWIVYNATNAQIRASVRELKRRKIAIAIETGPLSPTGACPPGEGFAAGEGLAAAYFVKSAGGSVRYFAFDEPFFFAALYSGEGACHWDKRRVAEGVAAFVRDARKAFPKARFGDIEPLTAPSDVRRYEEWIDTYREVTGENLAFFHVDTSWGAVPRWPELLRELEQFARSRGIPFGVIYNGDGDDVTDDAWLSKAQQRFELYETEGGRPDAAVLQSWTDKPDRVLPESRRTFTNLILRYTRPRTRLELEAAGGEVAGRLLADRPLGGQLIRVTAERTYAGSTFSSRSVLGSATATTGADGRFRASFPANGAASVVARYPGSSGYWPAYAADARGALANVARGRPATASAEQATTSAGNAVDGNASTPWIAGAFAPQWIELDLGEPTAVAAVRLAVEQTPRVGETVHAVLGRGADGAYRELHVFAGRTTDGDVLEYAPDSPWEGIRYLRVETRASPSWVAWRELEVFSAATASLR